MAEAMLAVLLGAHLLLVDVAMVGPLLCVWLDWRQWRYADGVAGRAGLTLARWTIWGLVGGILTGAVLLGARWWPADDRYFAALGVVPRSRLWFAGAELVFFLVCMSAYVRLWNRWHRWRIVHRLLAIAASTNLLAHFPALFAMIAVLSTRGEPEPLGASGYRRMLLDPEVLSHVVHVWIAALAVAGAALMEIALRSAPESQDRGACARLIQRGAVLALAATLAQVPAGFWLTMEMPEAQRMPLLGGDLLATALFAASLLVVLSLVHRLAGIVLGDNGPKQVRRSIGLMCLVVMLMTGTRCRTDEPGHVAHSIAPRASTDTEAGTDPPGARRLRLAAVAFQ